MIPCVLFEAKKQVIFLAKHEINVSYVCTSLYYTSSNTTHLSSLT